MSHPVKAIDIKTPYKTTGCTNGYLWLERGDFIFIRHSSSYKVFKLYTHPGPDEIYLIENYPMSIETNNVGMQKLALLLRDREIERYKRELQEREEARIAAEENSKKAKAAEENISKANEAAKAAEEAHIAAEENIKKAEKLLLKKE